MNHYGIGSWHEAAIRICLVLAATCLMAVPTRSAELNAEQLAEQVTIYRDGYGVPHIDAQNDAAAAFGFAYAQAEDFFWQIEDSYLQAVGRYAEVNGPRSLHVDLLNRAFRIAERSPGDFEQLDPQTRAVCNAFAAGLNHYLATNPETKPRLITQFEGWHMLAFQRHLFMDFLMTTKYIPHKYMEDDPRKISSPVGSNAWAISGERTASGNAMLMCNPHQPSFGYGQFYEAHIRSGDEYDFSGATFFGYPLLTIGHNQHLGWSHTVNRPDNIDFWLVKFDDPDNPDQYRLGDETLTAERWTSTVKVLKGSRFEEQEHTFRSTVQGPIIAQLNETDFLAMNIGNLMESNLVGQHIKMVRAKNLDEFRDAMSSLDLLFFNTIYADREGHVFFAYNGAIPKRKPGVDSSQTLDGSNPDHLWQGLHSFDELPQIVDPPTGWLQSCNSSPFTSTDVGNPLIDDFPPYMADDRNIDKLRSKVSRMILREVQDLTLDQLQELVFDTRMYWPLSQLPHLQREYEELVERDPKLAERAAPYFEHLLDWDCRNSHDCTQSTLCEAWFSELYGSVYPPEMPLQQKYIDNPDQKFRALVDAASKLRGTFGDWKVPWGDAHRMQRHPDVADFFLIPFDDKKPSVPCAAVPGTMGAVFTNFYTPSINIPFVKQVKKNYGVVGTSYLATFEFTPDGVRGATLTQFGASSDPDSPHFMDQTELMSQQKLKPELYDWAEISSAAQRHYHPGE